MKYYWDVNFLIFENLKDDEGLVKNCDLPIAELNNYQKIR
jgi:hypothetical protein